MFEIIAFLFLIIFGVVQYNRINRLENRLDQWERNQPVAPTSEVSAIPRPPQSSAFTTDYEQSEFGQSVDYSQGRNAQVEAFKQLYSSEPTALDHFWAWIKRDLMVKIGSLLLLMALGWFVSYAFAERWIDEQGRIALGLIFGSLVLILGAWRISKFRHQGSIFILVGAATILLTMFAARGLYEMFTPLSALFIMFMTVVLVAFISVRYKHEPLSFSSLLLGAVAPLFTSASLPTFELFGYLMALSLGTLWVVWVTGWTRLTLTALIITFLYSLGQLFDTYYYERDLTLMFSFLFVSLFFVANVVSLVRRRKEGGYHLPVHALTALGTAIFLIVWIESVAMPEWKSLLYVAWSLVFGFGTYVVYMFTANRNAFYIYGGTSAVLIGIATAAQLDGPVLTIAYLLEIVMVMVVAGFITNTSRLSAKLGVLFLLPIVLALGSLESYYWYGAESIWHEQLVVVALTSIILLLAGHFLHSLPTRPGESFTKIMYLIMYGVSTFFAVSLVWLVSHSLIDYDLATMISLVVYTVIGIVAFVYGKVKNAQFIRWVGIVFIGGVVARLLLVDVIEMDTVERIITFAFVSLLLISTAFVRKLQPNDGGSVNENSK